MHAQGPPGLDSRWVAQGVSLEPATEYESYPLFALKSNLLFDLALTPNIEVEVPLGKRWSLNAEYQGGWWLRESNFFCWQIVAGGLETRYRLGDVEERPWLSGWFVGLFMGGGYYDFQFSEEGTQGELYIMAGASGGYTLPLSERWRLEFSSGIGYLTSDYRHYRMMEDYRLIKQGESMQISMLMPVKLKVSLLWIINGRKRVKGGKGL
ncbi:MAG: DUF3575 domain-containing protein [Tannerellaceae bacterium]|jgi:hypothetical protein|nr:DUF3575 domain-containing protein [Tannerellaceae bacterium]